MHREIVKWGEDPYNLKLDEREQAVVNFGRQLAKNANGVSDSLYELLAKYFTPAQIVDLTVFGALMIVNNVFNSALQIDLDTSLDDYRIQPEKYFS
jgi:alkylhydroperoxidase family enzyme